MDLALAAVVTLYTGRDVNRRLLRQLSKLKPGARVVSHGFDLEGCEPDPAEDGVKRTVTSGSPR